MFYVASKLALKLWYVSLCASRLGEIRGRGEFLCFEIVSDQLAGISISTPGTQAFEVKFFSFRALIFITYITFLVFNLRSVCPDHVKTAYFMLRICSGNLAANQIRQYISNRIDESNS